MAIESLPQDVQKEINKQLKDDENTFKGCKVDVKDSQVHVSIPIKGTSDYNTYIFSKRDVRALFENLYSS